MTMEDEKYELALIITNTEGLLHKQRLKDLMHSSCPSNLPSLTPQQCHMVITVHESGVMTARQLTQSLHVNAPAVSIMLDRLVELGVLTREGNPHDRREVLVQISPAFATHMEEIKRRYVQTILGLFEKIGIDHARMWGLVCKRIQEAVVNE